MLFLNYCFGNYKPIGFVVKINKSELVYKAKKIRRAIGLLLIYNSV